MISSCSVLAYTGALFLLLSFCTVRPSFSQENYQPGRILSLQGDTVSGFIDNRNWEYNPQEIHFRTRATQAVTVYRPSDIREFWVQDEWYIAAVVALETSPYKINELPNTPDIKLESTAVFLQTLVAGNKSLLYYKRRKGREQFYIRQGSDFDLLRYKTYIKEQNGRRAIAENRQYLQQLALYLQACPSTQESLREVSYSKKRLIKLFLGYYECTSSLISSQRTTEKIRVEGGIVGGGTISSLSFTGQSVVYLSRITHSSSNNFSGGLFLEATLPRNQRKWSLYSELLYTSYQTAGHYDRLISADEYLIIDTRLGYTYIKLNNLIRFAYPTRHFRPFMNVGISNGFAIQEENYRRVKTKTFGVERMEEDRAIKDTRIYEQGLLAGIGAKFRKHSLEARYEVGNGMSKYTGLRSITNRYSLLAGYRF